MDKIETFEDLDVYKVCRESRKRLSKLVKTFPPEEKYRLVDQIIRASRSVTANIAEGYGRYHYQENIQFCRQARGSVCELLDHINTALDEEYISREIHDDYRKDILRAVQVINGYIRYLQKCKTINE